MNALNAVETFSLTKTYQDVTAVDHLNLQIKKGELFSLLGINGAGKTTTIKMLSCLTAPTLGEAWLNGISITADPSGVKAIIAVSPQETAIAPHLTVKENLALLCGVHGFSKEKREQKIAELSESFGFQPIEKKKAGKLSGGWQRRLSLAMALISEPEILFMDEPTLGLDILARTELWNMIRSLKGQMTMILTTHYMEEAESLSDRVGIMKDGRLLTCASPAELKEQTGTHRLEDAFIRIVTEEGKA